MSQSLIDSIEVLASTCVELCMTGKLWAHYQYSPHTDCIDVYAFPVNHQYIGIGSEPPIFSHKVYLTGRLATDPVGQIHAIIEKLNGYRMEDAA